MSECKHMEEEDTWNETAGFFQKLRVCKISGKTCQGSEEICSNFVPVEEQKPAEPEPEITDKEIDKAAKEADAEEKEEEKEKE